MLIPIPGAAFLLHEWLRKRGELVPQEVHDMIRGIRPWTFMSLAERVRVLHTIQEQVRNSRLMSVCSANRQPIQ